MGSPIPLATVPDRLRAAAVLGGVALVAALHRIDSALEGLHFIPLLLAGHWWGRWPALACGVLVAGICGALDPADRGRLPALALFPAVAFTAGLLADRLRRESRRALEAERAIRREELLAALGELSAVLEGSVAKGSVARLDRALTEFLRFARPGKPGEEPADPALAAKAVFTLLRPQAEKAGVDLRLHGGGVDRLVACPPEALRQALLHLCLNALEAMGEKPGAVTVRITEPEDGRVRIVVDDTGPGVPAAERERIFRPFHSTKEGGTGLGLAVVAAIAIRCGGGVEVGDAEGGGARFTVVLPRAPVPEVVSQRG